MVTKVGSRRTSSSTRKVEPPQRDRARTEKAILDAVGRLILREGLSGVGVNALAREAGADKVLVYRYFGDLDGVYRAYAERSNFWWTLDEILGDPPPDPRRMPLAELVKMLLRRHAAQIRARPITLAVIAAEPANRTPLVVALEEVRERRSLELSKWVLDNYGEPKGVDLAAVTSIVAAAIDYLAGRARNIRVYGGVGIRSNRDWERIHTAIDTIVDCLLKKK